ncbi:uncharacterized protein BO95DRAFT_235513 [Aspergillus brunneoviolaceus CBS 621.78]|uniref:Uncharacterized protein n=1 Tax=Aspergillus brunneoviolaceus CBS 621.78 TaxID=1450534 RepID=A0ACD1FZN2_9EURO|nr:hypothetical protein BO95DRAFT_235513 [Aspergillus brunneoviolaceus CBS 621.78]RAH42424.1 hypothetical protein BO95DRAFT_235513 [Aspergillus brunneoviolaceus CBS 621.78]
MPMMLSECRVFVVWFGVVWLALVTLQFDRETLTLEGTEWGRFSAASIRSAVHLGQTFPRFQFPPCLIASWWVVRRCAQSSASAILRHQGVSAGARACLSRSSPRLLLARPQGPRGPRGPRANQQQGLRVHGELGT